MVKVFSLRITCHLWAVGRVREAKITGLYADDAQAYCPGALKVSEIEESLTYAGLFMA